MMYLSSNAPMYIYDLVLAQTGARERDSQHIVERQTLAHARTHARTYTHARTRAHTMPGRTAPSCYLFQPSRFASAFAASPPLNQS
jgi:hypothetical protein